MKALKPADLVRAIFHASAAGTDANIDTPPTRPSTDHATADVVATAAPVGVVDDAVLDVEGTAKLLHVGRNTVYALVAKNQIPHRRLGKQIRFSRAAVVSWLSTSWRVAKEGK